MLLIAKKDTPRFERAVVRWHGRFELEVRALADAQMLLGALAGLREPVPRIQLETIGLIAERYKADAVARTARRRLSS